MGKLNNTIIDITISDLKIIPNPKGDILHVMKSDEDSFKEFGEIYISKINFNEIKAWKLHKRMTSNIVVPSGKVKFVLCDLRTESKTYNLINEFTLSILNYKRISVPPGICYGFKGIGKLNNLIINFADIMHDPSEQENLEINYINYKW